MQQRFSMRPCSVRDFEEWHKKGELELAPKFQRRNVWSPKARSYLIDTIIRGKPIPKIYMRQDVNPKTRRVTREIVDGQQRLHTVLSFLQDGFPILRTHNEEHGGKRFSELEEETQREILKYEFSVDLLQDMPDQEVYDIFARLNTYSVTLNAQELRNAKYFGEFKTTVYTLSNEFLTFWQVNKIFSDPKILRMAEAEFVSELLIAMSVGIQERSSSLIDNFYKTHDDEFAHRKTLMKRFRETIDTIGGIMGTDLAASKFGEPRLLYPLFCSVYHLQFGLPDMGCERRSFKQSDYPKLRIALEKVEEIFKKLEEEEERRQRIEAGETVAEVYGEEVDEEAIKDFDPLTGEERRFYNAYSVHWVHAENRRTRTRYICRLMVEALG
ncbi:MAG: DUF262 domain-containing protein [Kosmotogaceae bacterium]|nr:DUF262 domain-containing protein [Kosmotogaceae bacterium]